MSSTQEKCKHKFRTNLDGLVTKEAPSVYFTIIFCEKCGLVKHNSNWTKQQQLESQL